MLDNLINTKFGVRVKSVEAGQLYEYNLGVRDAEPQSTPAVLPNSLLLDFLLKNGLKVSRNAFTRDILYINFNQKSRGYKTAIKSIRKKISRTIEEVSNAQNADEKERLENKLTYLESIENTIEVNKDKFIEKSVVDIREEFYRDGVWFEYITKDKNGEVKNIEKIHYQFLFRSSGKAKQSSAVFISDRLFKRADKFMRMGIKLPKHGADVVSMAAYMALIGSSICDTIKIDPSQILVLRDKDTYTKGNVTSIELDESGKPCVVNKVDTLKSCVFDGGGLIDKSIFPEDKKSFLLLRQHFFKSAVHKADIQLFFKDYFGEKYDNARVFDMWGKSHIAKDVKLIVTESSTKWIKFNVSFDDWAEKVSEMGNMFGIVKDAHLSKNAPFAKSSYQHTNALDIDTIKEAMECTLNYIQALKSNDESAFVDYLQKNQTFDNDFAMLADIVSVNPDFAKSEYYKKRKKRIISAYVESLKLGKLIHKAENLTIAQSPYALLLHSVGEPILKDKTFQRRKDKVIQCWCSEFETGEIASFRNPFNSRNNLGCLENIQSDILDKYFFFNDGCIAVNTILTDFQDRNNGSDADGDSIYCTDSKAIVAHAKKCVIDYPTVVNNIPQKKNKYDNTPHDKAVVDSLIGNSQRAIGESTNVAAVLQSYFYSFGDKKYYDWANLMAVACQVSIDGAKRLYELDTIQTIKDVREQMDMETLGMPYFMKGVKEYQQKKQGGNTKTKYNINYDLICPMNEVCRIVSEENRKVDDRTEILPMDYFFQKFPVDYNRKKVKKIESLIEEYQKEIDLLFLNGGGNVPIELLEYKFEELVKYVKQFTPTKHSDCGWMSFLIDRAMLITNMTKGQKYSIARQTNRNYSKLLGVLYAINPNAVVEIFCKNIKKSV